MELFEWRVVPFVLLYKDKRVVKSFRSAINKIPKFNPKLVKMQSDLVELIKVKKAEKKEWKDSRDDYVNYKNNLAIFAIKKWDYDPVKLKHNRELIVPILINVTNTKNEKYYNAVWEDGAITVPSMGVGLKANWADVSASNIRDAFDRAEKAYEKKKSMEFPLEKKFQKVEIVLTHYMSETGGKAVAKSTVDKEKNILANLLAGFPGIAELKLIREEGIPAEVVYVRYKEHDTIQASIIFETDGVKDGDKLTDETDKRIKLPVIKLESTAGLQWVNPGNILKMIKNARNMIYQEKK